MKISVLGDIIETENIYKITNIRFDNKCIKVSYGIIAGVYFDVIGCGNTHLVRVGLGVDLKNISTVQKSKLKEIRDVIIAYWSNNQSNIPKIEFKT